MKLRGILATALSLWLTLWVVPALAQVNPGSSPLSGKKGGTNNAFMQFAGPATAIKTFTLPNASGTIGVLNAIATWTAAQSFTDGTLILLGSSSGSSTLKAPSTGGGTATLFPGNDTIVGAAATQALTNKTFNCASNTCTVRLGSDVTGQLPIGNGGTGAASQPAAAIALLPTATRAGDILYWDGTNWNHLAGNNSGTNVLSENASGVPSWIASAGSGTVTSAVIAAGAGISVGGTCTITTSGTCTVTNAGVLSVDAQVGSFTTAGGIKSTGKVIQNTMDSQVLQAAPANPTATASTTQVMMGMGATCHLTPTYSSRVDIDFVGTVTNNTAGNVTSMNIRFGTGTAPANGAALTGTALLNTVTSGGGTGALQAPSFHLPAIATGLTPGTAYWFDMSIAASANTSTISNMNCTLRERM